MKDIIRKAIASVMAAAIMTSVFSGCSGDTLSDTSADNTIPAYSSTLDTGNAPGGITDTDSSFTSVKYKFWFDSKEVIDAQNDALEHTGTPTGESLFGIWDIYQDIDGSQYILSGRTKFILKNGKVDLAELPALRTEGGDRIYTVDGAADVIKGIQEYNKRLASNGITPPASLEERVEADASITEEKTVEAALDIYVNNLKTDYTTADGKIDISSIFMSLENLGHIDLFSKVSQNTAVVSMLTAAGPVDVDLEFTDANVVVHVSTGEGKLLLETSEVVKIDNTLLFTPDALECALGYDVEIYQEAGFINIVTDNRDLLTETTVIDNEAVPEFVDVGEIVAPDPEADKIVEEREENIPMASTEEAEQHQQEREELQDMAENTQAYTTEGIPLTSDGDLTAPAKPTAGYKLPDGAQLEFTGDPSTAIYTELPDGCYWTPVPAYPNAFTDPAGNCWPNSKSGVANGTGNRGEGYYTPDDDYHPSQAEIDRAIAFNEQIANRHENGPTNGEQAQMSKEEGEALADMFGF